jgi:hypothetical protein
MGIPERRKSIIHWLLDSAPSIRWQVMRDLMDESDEVVGMEHTPRLTRIGLVSTEKITSALYFNWKTLGKL